MCVFAGDTAIFYLCYDLDDLKLSIQHNIQSVSFWMTQNNLVSMCKKTKFMMVKSKAKVRSLPDVTVNLNGVI